MLKVIVRAYGDLKELLANQIMVDLKPRAKLKDLINKLGETTGSSRGYIGSYNAAGPTLTILINGRNTQTLKKLETTLKDGDAITILPPFVGG